LVILKVLQFVFTIAAAFLLLFYAPFDKLTKILILCGYYFVFEYAVIARNYMPAIAATFFITIIFSKKFKYQSLYYYLLLLFISNVHLVGVLLAASIHAGFLFENIKNRVAFLKNLAVGMLILFPSVYFICPPADSELNFKFWSDIWTTEKFYLFKKVVIESLIPWPDVHNHNWWNTHFITDNTNYLFLSRLVFTLLLFLILFIVRKNKTALVVLASNLILTYILSVVFPLNTARYVGFVFIGFLIALWLSYKEMSLVNKIIMTVLLLLQMPAAIFAFRQDAIHTFSCASSVVEMNRQIPKDSFVTTDYWCLNDLSAYIDKPFYSIELKKEISFLLWDRAMAEAIHFNYAKGLNDLLQQQNNKSYYFFSTRTHEQILKNKTDEKIILHLVNKSTGAIENSGNVFLYLVSSSQ
jgi:hypothetical protein